MLSNSNRTGQDLESALSEVRRLHRFTGPPNEFWPAFLAATGALIQASRGLLIARDPGQPERLKKFGDWSNNGHASRPMQAFNLILPQLTEKCLRDGNLKQALDDGLQNSPQHFALAIGLPLQGSKENCVAAFLLTNASEAEADEALVRLRLAAEIPQAYQTHQTAIQFRSDAEKMASVMDVMVLVNSERRFLSAAMALCNSLATRFLCDRVSLGWLEGSYVRLKSMSRTERFDKNMAAVRSLEMVMEEALDQNGEIVWPAPDGFSLVTKDHETFSRDQNAGNICSVPLRLNDKPVAVLTCERLATAFSQIELQQFRLACDQAITRLADLKRRDRWFGALWAEAIKERCAKVLGPERTWTKVFLVLGCLTLILVSAPIFTYKVEGNFILRSDEVSFLTAPFDSYIRSVEVRPGDSATQGTVLLRLNTDDLILQEAAALADQVRYQREAEKARAEKTLPEMQIALALSDQSKARLELIRYRLQQAVIKAPFDSVIVEGDLRQRIGAPIKQGEGLFKVARTDTLYVEAEVNERDISEILNKSEGQIAFVTQPKLKFPIQIVRVEPAAFPKDQENVFLLRCSLSGEIEPWWRPGMSGVSKFQVEKRTLIWVFTHRTVDFLRMFFWW